MRRIALWCATTLAAAGIAVLALGEFYRVSAVSQHPLWVYRGLALARDTLVAVGASGVEVPADFEPTADAEGAALFERHCVQCHGAPGVAPREFALGMMPVPTNLVHAARSRSPAEIYWFIRYGLKMSGMPAWELRMSDADIWRVTRFVETLPALAPADYTALAEQAPDATDAIVPVEAEADAGIDPERGRLAMQVHGCPSCHVIPGIVGPAHVRVGPSLDTAATRSYIAGVLPNTPQNLARWIVDPRAIDPLSAMPDLDVAPDLARDMAAYLYSTTPDAAWPDGDGTDGQATEQDHR